MIYCHVTYEKRIEKSVGVRMWQLPEHDRTKDMDEHNQPTEPLQRIVLPAFLPPPVQAGPLPEEPTIGNLQAQDAQEPTTPLPALYANAPTLPPQPVYNPTVQAAAYPVLPPLPTRPEKARRDRPAGGADKAEETPGQEKKTQSRRSGVPIFVGLCFVAVQLLLLLRFVLSFLPLSANSGWGDSITTVYTISDAFLLPFRLVFQQITLPMSASTELYTLLAILVYGLISRIIVRLLKMLLR